MDWIKVKVKHFEYDFAEASEEVIKLWISSMIYTAAIEKMPTISQLDARLSKKGHKNLINYLKKIDIKLEEILEKVLEDVNHIQARRKHEREYMSEYRCKVLRKDLRGVCSSGKDKIREEKRREEDIGVYTPNEKERQKVSELIHQTLKDKVI